MVLLLGCIGKILYGHSPDMDETLTMKVLQDTVQRTTDPKTKESVEQKEGEKAVDATIKRVPKAKNQIVPKTVGAAKVDVKTSVTTAPVKVRVKVKVNPTKIKL